VRGIWIVIFGLLSFETYAQAEVIETDSLTIEQPDSINRHFPNKATMFSAVLPGLGQIYNRQVWKVPFIYGGFIGLGITIERYQRLYNNYRRAYFELNDKNPNTTYYYEVLPEGSEVSESNPKQYNDLLIKGIEDRSRSRDLYIIGTVGFYLFNILDANVNAHFIDFDISEDLSFNLEPVGFDPFTNYPVYGICMRYQF
jgi:hypothetical protein